MDYTAGLMLTLPDSGRRYAAGRSVSITTVVPDSDANQTSKTRQHSSNVDADERLLIAALIRRMDCFDSTFF